MMKKINIERILDYNYFLVLASFVLFIDTYMILFLNSKIGNIDLDFLKNNIGNIIVMLFIYSFFMAIITKIVNIIINNIYIYKFKKYEIVDRSNYMINSNVLNLAIKNNNSVLYNYYMEDQKNVDSIYNNRYLSTAILILLTINFFISTEINISIIKTFEIWANNHNEWYYGFMYLIPIGTIGYIIYSIFDIGELYYIYLNKEIQDSLVVPNKSLEEEQVTPASV